MTAYLARQREEVVGNRSSTANSQLRCRCKQAQGKAPGKASDNDRARTSCPLLASSSQGTSSPGLSWTLSSRNECASRPARAGYIVSNLSR